MRAWPIPCPDHFSSANAARNTKCSQNQRNAGCIMRTNKVYIKCKKISCFCRSAAAVARHPRRRRGLGRRVAASSPLPCTDSPLRRPGWGRLSLGMEFTIPIATARCRQRRLDIAKKFALPWRRNCKGSLHYEGYEGFVPSTSYQDKWSRCSLDDLACN